MNKLTELLKQIDEFKRLENQRNKKMEEVKFEADEQNKIAQWFGPPLNFVAREITKLVIESDLLSLLEEKDKALEVLADKKNWTCRWTENSVELVWIWTEEGKPQDIARKALNTSSNNEGD